MSETALALGAVLALVLLRNAGGGGDTTTGLDGSADAPPPSTRSEDLARGEAEGLRRQREGTLQDGNDYDRRDPSSDPTGAGIIVGDPRGGERHQAHVRVFQASGPVRSAALRQWDPLRNTGAGFEYHGTDGSKSLVLIEQGGVWWAPHLVRTRSTGPGLYFVGYWLRPDLIPDPTHPRMWSPGDPVAAQLLNDYTFARPDVSGQPSLVAAVIPGTLLVSQHVLAVPAADDARLFGLGARRHPVTGRPWRVFADWNYILTSGDGSGRPGNPDWSWAWHGPCFPEHRSNSADTPTAFEPHVGGGAQCRPGFVEQVADLSGTGDENTRQWVGVGTLGQPDGTRGVWDPATGLMRRQLISGADAARAVFGLAETIGGGSGRSSPTTITVEVVR